MSANTTDMTTEERIGARAARLANEADGNVNNNQLAGGHLGRMFKTFSKRPVLEYFGENEQPKCAITTGKNNDGIVITERDSETDESAWEKMITGDPYIVTILTDRRLLIVGQEFGADNVLSVPLRNVETATILREGRLKSSINVQIKTDSYTYTIGVKTSSIATLKEDVASINESVADAQSTSINLNDEYTYEEKHHFAAEDTTLICKECRGEIDPDAQRCPHCGFDPQSNSHGALWHGTALATSFSPIGWAMMGKGIVDEEKAKQDIGERAPKKSADSDNGETPMDTLQRLSDLHDDGVITDEEFKSKKQDLLERL